jgi:WD40 repeat protein
MPTCARCGATLGEGRLAGLCPRCMLLDALGDAADPLADIAEVAADVPSGQLRSVLSEMQTGSGLDHAAFSHDSRTLASGEPTRAKIWNVASGRLLMTFKGLGRSAFGPLFSPDGNTLLIGGSRHPSLPGPIRLLHAPSFAEIEQAEHAGGSVAVLAPE